MKIALLLLLTSNLVWSKTVNDKFSCDLNYQWTNANFPEIAKAETNLKARIEVTHENMILTDENKFKIENISSLENKKYKFLKNLVNENNEIVLKDLKVDTDHDGDNEDFVYHNKIKGVQIYISTQDFLSWSVKFQDPKKANDYLIFLDCKRK